MDRYFVLKNISIGVLTIFIDKKGLNTVLITGGTSGLGLELVKLFHEKGFTVFATGRDSSGLTGLGSGVRFVKTDFSEPYEVKKVIRNLLDQGTHFDLVINNAGVLSPPRFTTCSNGVEYTFQVNFITHLLINELIIENRNNTAPLIIVSVTSPVFKFVKPVFSLPVPEGYRPFRTYAESKYYMLMTGEYFMEKYPGRSLNFIGFDPGTFSSHIYRMQKGWFRSLYRIAGPFMRSSAEVAARLGAILDGKELLNGMVYRKVNSYLEFKCADRKAMTQLFSKVSEITAKS